MSGKRHAARQLTSNGKLDITQVYALLRDSVQMDRESLPDETDGPFSLVGPRTTRITAGGPLPHPDDVRALLTLIAKTLETFRNTQPELGCIEAALRRHVDSGVSLHRSFGYAKVGRGAPRHRANIRAELGRVLARLDSERSKRTELRFLQLALRRHVEFGLSLHQAFGYGKVGKGPSRFGITRGQRIACAVFEQRFIRGRNAETAGFEAGKEYGINKTQALKAFDDHPLYALETFTLKRLQRFYPQLTERYATGKTLTSEELQTLRNCRPWSPIEMRRLKRYEGYKAKLSRPQKLA